MKINRFLLKSLLRESIKHKWYKQPLYFSTLVFPSTCKIASLNDKLKSMRCFVKTLHSKESFDYFWVKAESACDNVQIYMISDWKYSSGFLKHHWNTHIRVDVKFPSCTIELVKDLEYILEHIFKEDIIDYGLSSFLRDIFKDLICQLSYSNVTDIKNKLYTNFNIGNKIVGTSELQLKFEHSLFENFEKEQENPYFIQWMDKLSFILTNERKNMFDNLNKNARQNKLLSSYLSAIDKQPLGFDILWRALIFFLSSSAYYETKRSINTFMDKLSNLLINLLNEKNDYDLMANPENKYKLALIFRTSIEQFLCNYFKIDQAENTLNNIINITIHFVQEYKDLSSSLGFRDLSGWNPMVIKPKPWKIRVTLSDNDVKLWKKTDAEYYETGGYLNNGRRFMRNLCKPNLQSKFVYTKQDSLGCINYLQNQELKINSNLLEFILLNLDIIYNKLFEGWKDEKSLNEHILEIKKKRNKFFNKKIDKPEQSINDIYNQLNNSISIASQLEAFNKIIELSKIYSSYDKIYFTYEVDFRGRIYAVSDYLNYQGNKLARNLIYFHKESKMNLPWFKLYCVRKYGLVGHLRSAEEMITYFDNSLAAVMMNYRVNLCWLEADDIWSFLNCCIEYEKYLVLGDFYQTGMPLYFDATCSGSQLISLLLHNYVYAESLNLTPKSPKDPIGDYYWQIIENYFSFLKNSGNISLLNQINEYMPNASLARKFFKHIIMTLNYGLTSHGVLMKLVQTNDKLALNIPYPTLRKIQKSFWQFIHQVNLYSSLDIISNIVSELGQANKSVILYSNSNGFTINPKESNWLFCQWYNVHINKRLSFDKKTKGKKRITHHFTFNMPLLDTIDVNKQKLSIKANLIHHLDAIWVHNVLQLCRHDDKFHGVFVIHDSFGVLMEDIDILNSNVRLALAKFFKDEKNINKLFYQLRGENTAEIDIELQKLLSLAHKPCKINLDKAYYLIFPG